jgi:hypothetical protein
VAWAPHGKALGLLRGKQNFFLFVCPAGSAKHFPSETAHKSFLKIFWAVFIPSKVFFKYFYQLLATGSI